MNNQDEQTPIQEYNINGHDIFVKREDLFLASFQPMVPALAKLRGARVVLQNLKAQSITKIGCFDTRISKSGQGIAFLCKELGMHCVVGYPKLKSQTYLNDPQKKAQEMGAEIWPVQAGRTAPCYSAFKNRAIELDYMPLPLGITFKETAQEVAKISEKETERFRTIVVSTGTGTIASGIALGTKAKVIGISCGMSPEKQWHRINIICQELNVNSPKNLQIINSNYNYYDKADTLNCPFPTSPYYDAKSWEWLLKNFDKLEEPVLFWNIGV